MNLHPETIGRRLVGFYLRVARSRIGDQCVFRTWMSLAFQVACSVRDMAFIQRAAKRFLRLLVQHAKQQCQRGLSYPVLRT